MKRGVAGVVEGAVQSAQEWTDDLKERAAKQAAARMTAHEAKMDKALAEQGREIRQLRGQVKGLMKARRGGGFPWFPLLLVGGGVYLYRMSPGFKEQVNGLLDRINPDLRGNLARAGDAARDAVQAVMQGEDPRPAAGNALGELKQAGQKGLERASDMAEAVKRGHEGQGTA